MSNSRCLLLASAACVLAAGGASTASAATVLINSDHLATSSYTTNLGGTVDGNPFSADVYESPDVLNVSFNGGPSHDILAFCVDIFHNFNSSTPPVTYETAAVQNNSDSPASGGGTPLANLISGEIGYLADVGKTTSDPEHLAGIQGAIWQIEYPSLTLSGGSSYVPFYVALANAWGIGHPNFAGFADGIYPQNGNTQGFGYTQGFTIGGSVPEPATWSMTILGFGALGAALRLRRRRPASAASA